MTKNNYRMYILIFIAFFAVISAVGISCFSYNTSTQKIKLLPKLKVQKNNIIAINIDHQDSVITLIADNNKNWFVGEMDGYPAINQKVNNLISSLENLELIEFKTDDPNKYPELWLNDVNQKESNAYRISLVGKDGNIMDNIIVGKQQNDTIFIRKNNDPQVWLVKGSLDIYGDITSWVEEPLFPVDEQQILKITLTDTTLNPEEELVFFRTEKDKSFSFFANTKMKLNVSPEDGNRIANAFQNLIFIDAKLIQDIKNQDSLKTLFKIEVETINGDIFGLIFVYFNDEIWFQTFSSINELNQKQQGWLYKINPKKLIALLPPPVVQE